MSVTDDKLTSLINFYRYPMQCWPYHHGDVTVDTLTVLEDVSTCRAEVEAIKDVADEVLAQLPAEDELSAIIDTLKDALDMNKSEMIELIQEVLGMLEEKQTTMSHAAEYARDIWRERQ